MGIDWKGQDEITLRLKRRGDIKAGDNRHLDGASWNLVGPDGKPLGVSVFDFENLGGQPERLMGTTNVGDARAALRTSVCVGKVYEDEHVAASSKHTRSVVAAKGRTQLEATVKTLAGDVNSPFGGIWAFSKPLELETARFINPVMMEGVVAPDYEAGAAELLRDTDRSRDPNNRKSHERRFIFKTGNLTRDDIEVVSMQVLGADVITQDYDLPFKIRGNSFVAAGNNGKRDLSSLDKRVVDAMQFGAVVATHFNSNLVFYGTDGAVAGLGDGCGARFVAAMKGRMIMLEISPYAAVRSGDDMDWERALYDTPFKREEFEAVLDPKAPIAAISDAFCPKPDGWIEATGVDRVRPEFENGVYNHEGVRGNEKIVLKKVNFAPDREYPLVAAAVFHPGGSYPGDIYTNEMADKFGIPTVVAISPEKADAYFKALANKGKDMPAGHRFFNHLCF